MKINTKRQAREEIRRFCQRQDKHYRAHVIIATVVWFGMIGLILAFMSVSD